ncbi:hypothetical protein LSTR_LSTR009533 [Laodelphax striatellus]|uniref:C2H2-type domain-containing protein n=1 Tax=Laodelphax striatellus TaxID=195883 RepID=A0A482XQC4_LAOST|nr:hypothetical protein LSTR_LSTR009533 [Laodelphax striatellus]
MARFHDTSRRVLRPSSQSDVVAGSLQCSESGKQYATLSNLESHKQTHGSSTKKCETCGKAYLSKSALHKHLMTHNQTHACNICGKLFSRPWLLKCHKRSHTGERPYCCAHCGKTFSGRSNLRVHIQLHSTDKKFECHRCHKTFAVKLDLRRHLLNLVCLNSLPDDSRADIEMAIFSTLDE